MSMVLKYRLNIKKGKKTIEKGWKSNENQGFKLFDSLKYYKYHFNIF